MNGAQSRSRAYLLPIACGLGAVMLIVSAFVVRFRIDVEGTIVDRVRGGGTGVALVILGVFALGALFAVLRTGSRPAALAVGVAGLVALVLVILGDLPDVNRKGTLPDFVTGKAMPAAGFWLELVGAAVLAVCGVALASMGPDQLERLVIADKRGGQEVETTPPSQTDD